MALQAPPSALADKLAMAPPPANLQQLSHCSSVESRSEMDFSIHTLHLWKEWPPDLCQTWKDRLDLKIASATLDMRHGKIHDVEPSREERYSAANICSLNRWDPLYEMQLAAREPRSYGVATGMVAESPLDSPQNFIILPIENCMDMLQECRQQKCLAQAKHVHTQICSNGLDSCSVIGNYIVPMYVDCGSLQDAQQVFEVVYDPNEIAWTSLIIGHVNSGQSKEALNIYWEMRLQSVYPRSYTLVALVKACTHLQDLQEGLRVHAEATENGYDGDAFVGNSLITMYIECGSLSQACKAFKTLPGQDVISWTSLMAGYVEHGQEQEALVCFDQMQAEGIAPGAVTFACSLKACSSAGALGKGREHHIEATKRGFEQNSHIGNTLVGMYGKCTAPIEAHEVFRKLSCRDVVSWTAVIASYAECGPSHEAIELYEVMECEGVPPNVVTFTCVLKACCTIGSARKGREVHTQLILKGFERNLTIGNCLIDTYAKCSALAEAQYVFDKLSVHDVVSWTALIAGYTEHGCADEALACYRDMQLQGIHADAFTFSCILKACSIIQALGKGREIHLAILEKGLGKDGPICNTLIDMYAKCGWPSEAQRVFDELPGRSVVSWTSLIMGYAEHGTWKQVFCCFDRMQSEGVSPNAATFSCLLRACGSIGATEKGRAIHLEITANKLDMDPIVGNSLISMYAMCGSLSEAQEVFEKLPIQDAAAYSMLIKGYGVNHDGMKAVLCFETMLSQGVKPDAVTFTCLFTACCYGSLVREGQDYFKMMVEEYGIEPSIEHYVSIVGLLARSGHPYDAERFLEMLRLPSQRTWAALLSACKTHGEEELAMRCFEELVDVNAYVPSWYVLMASVYAGASKWDAAQRLEEVRKHGELVKTPASALIEVNGELHEFFVGSDQSDDVVEMVKTMNLLISREGHMPDVDSIVKPVADSTKELNLCEHAEKLALAFGLLHTPQGQTLRVTKSMRICNDCHDASKTLSRIEKREIILRDDCSMHRFKDGFCSCGDVF